MNWIRAFVFLSVLVASLGKSQDVYDPKPAEKDFSLPMPDGGKMVFRPIFLGEGSSQFSMKSFKVGDAASGSFKEFPTDMLLGGSFILDNAHGGKEWAFYMGKYEVSEAQYEAIMKAGKPKDSKMPISSISWFEAQEFIHKYNLWLLENAEASLPKHVDALGFLRLPTEAEWEFAARGGNAVDANKFDQRHPYGAALNKHEWFSGAKSSFDKKKEIGLREPNPLGLHDILGNVSEMAISLYQIEYYQGRVGGFVSRGGNFTTQEKQIRSSLRNEIPFYGLPTKNKPTAQPNLGLRLVLAAPVFGGRQSIQDIEAEWPDYVSKTREPPAPPSVQRESVTVKTDAQLSDAQKSVQALKTELEALPGASEAMKTHIGMIEASFTNIESLIKSSDRRSARAFLQQAQHGALNINRKSKAIFELKKAIEGLEKIRNTGAIEKLKDRANEVQADIQASLSSYSNALRALEDRSEESITGAATEYKEYLVSQGQASELPILEIVLKHMAEFRKNKRSNEEAWLDDLQKLLPR